MTQSVEEKPYDEIRSFSSFPEAEKTNIKYLPVGSFPDFEEKSYRFRGAEPKKWPTRTAVVKVVAVFSILK
jgi:hypothetical protein